jgi:hypothetical protein
MNTKYYFMALFLAAAAAAVSCSAELEPWNPPESGEIVQHGQEHQAAGVHVGSPADPGLAPHEGGSETPARPGDGLPPLLEPRPGAQSGVLAPPEADTPPDEETTPDETIPPDSGEIPGGYASFDNTPAADWGPGPGHDVPVRNDAGDDIGTPGFWCNQIRFARSASPAARFTEAGLSLWLLKIDHASGVFSEIRPVPDLDAASDLVCSPAGDLSPDGKLERQLLSLWFNLVSRQVLWTTRLDELCRGSVPPPPDASRDWTIREALEWSEDALLDGMESDGSELFWKDVIDYVNNAQAPGAGDCAAR